MRTELLWIQMVSFSKGWGVREHERDYYQLCYVLSGTGDYLLEHQPMAINSGDLIFMPPGCNHGLPPQKGKKLLRYLNIQFRVHDEELAQVLQRCPTVSRPEDGRIGRLLVAGRNEWYSDGLFRKDVAAMNVEKALMLFVRESLGSIEKAAQDQDMSTGGIHELERKITDYISHNYDTCGLDELARELKYNKNYLCTYFKKTTGKTLNGYINEVRIDKAKELLWNSDYSVSDISAMVGFSSVHYFCKAFKKATGYTPNRMRVCINDPNAEWRRRLGDFGHRYYEET